jgi:hypothetical protein
MTSYSDQSFRFLSGGRFAPNRFPGFSYTGAGRRVEHGWLACQCSGLPFASEADCRRVPRPMLRSFALERDRPSQPRLSDLPLNWRKCSRLVNAGGGRTIGRVLRRLRSSTCSKLLSTGRRRREIIRPAAEGCSDRQQASPVCAKRRSVTVYEPGNLFGTGSYNDKDLLLYYSFLRAVGK